MNGGPGNECNVFIHREKVPKIATVKTMKLGITSLRGAFALGVAFFLSNTATNTDLLQVSVSIWECLRYLSSFQTSVLTLVTPSFSLIPSEMLTGVANSHAV